MVLTFKPTKARFAHLCTALECWSSSGTERSSSPSCTRDSPPLPSASSEPCCT